MKFLNRMDLLTNVLKWGFLSSAYSIFLIFIRDTMKRYNRK